MSENEHGEISVHAKGLGPLSRLCAGNPEAMALPYPVYGDLVSIEQAKQFNEKQHAASGQSRHTGFGESAVANLLP